MTSKTADRRSFTTFFLALLACFFDLADLGLGFLVRLIFGLLVALCVLWKVSLSASPLPHSPYRATEKHDDEMEQQALLSQDAYLGLKLLEFLLLLGPIGLYLLLGLVASFLDPLRTDYFERAATAVSFIEREVSKEERRLLSYIPELLTGDGE